MGSELSSHGGSKDRSSVNKKQILRRGKTLPGPSVDDEERNISPEPSVCSDSDLPYISYTVNRPIGDSPKLSAKQSSVLQRGKSLGNSAGSSPVRRRGPSRKASTSTSKATHDIVVVKPGKEPESQDKDIHLQKLNSIPMFLPIMRGTLNLPGMRDPEVLEKLDPQDVLGYCKKLQSYMTLCSEHVASNQNQITAKIREADFDLCRLVGTLGERQKKFTKATEKLRMVSELSHQLNRCHDQLNVTLELLEDLNNKLPPQSRIEPFVWTTG